VLFNKADCKSGGGHYSSQRSLGSGGPSGGFGGSAPTLGHWGNTWSSDISSWYDYGKFLFLLITIRSCLLMSVI